MSEDKNQWTRTPTPTPRFCSENRYFLTFTQAREATTGSPWEQFSGFSLADVRKKLVLGKDLVEHPGMPEMVFTPSEYEAAQLRAEHMAEKTEDVVVTLVLKSRFSSPVGTIRVESLPFSQLSDRIAELKVLAQKGGGIVFVISAYSEETKQEFWWNDMELDTVPRLSGYDQEYDRKRKGFRKADSGVL